MNKKIFKYVLLNSLTVFVTCFFVTLLVVCGYFFNQQKNELKKEALYISTAVNEQGLSFLKNIEAIEGTRITVIDKSGVVIYDNTVKDISSMENHAEREEFTEALQEGIGESSRHSNTLNATTSYYAVKLNSGDVIRISSEQYSFLSLINNMLAPMILVIVLVGFFSFLIATKASGSIVAPINEISLESPDESAVFDELKPLIRRIGTQNRQIARQVKEIKAEHERQDRMRKEFTANVSHELKTPLTSISGYAEIIKSGMVKEQDIAPFAGKIYDEAQRLSILVSDIMRLSQLDEDAVPIQKETVDLYELSLNTVSLLENLAKDANVTLSVSGSKVEILGVRQILSEIIFNLCDNAIKYNRDGGSVEVTVEKVDNGASISVKDTGIGIPSDDIPRIFERFYRINKSHSKEVGGTGLGLSIVKHGVAFHGAEIRVSSVLGEGTEISVIFPD